MVILDGELVGCDEQNFMHEILQKVSDAELFEHASRGPIALVFFGPNSCGKTSFIRRFLSLGDFLPVGNGSVSARHRSTIIRARPIRRASKSIVISVKHRS